jgi:hypothetical protein
MTRRALLGAAAVSLSSVALAACSLVTSLDGLQATDASTPDVITTPDASDAAKPDGPCVTESNVDFCKRLGKTCEGLTANDNCGVSRTVTSCGVCTLDGGACIDNVCKTPACNGSYAGTGTTIPSLNLPSVQAAMLGVSGDGASVLFLRGVQGCLLNTTPLKIADATSVNLPTPPTYVVQDIGSLPALAGMTRQQQSMTLSPDGLTIIGVGVGDQTFLESKRSAVGQTDFSVAAAGAFNTVNASLPQGGKFTLPVISADGLAFYYSIYNAQNAALNGIYEATRLQTNVPFDAGTKMPAIVQNYDGITGISADRMTLFVTKSFNATILSRASVTQPFATSNIAPPTSASRVQSIATCGYLFGTCAPGGCPAESICIWARK